jgi:hypothetical protein
VHRLQDRLEHDDPAHAIGMARRSVNREDAAPVVADQHDVAQVYRVEPRVEVANVILLAIALSDLPECPPSKELICAYRR